MHRTVHKLTYTLKHLAVQLVVAAAIAAVVATIVHGAEETSVAHAIVTALLAVGALALLLGAFGLGGVSPVGTLANMWVRLGTGDDTPPPGEIVANGTAVLLVTGALLIGAGLLLDGERRGHRTGA